MFESNTYFFRLKTALIVKSEDCFVGVFLIENKGTAYFKDSVPYLLFI